MFVDLLTLTIQLSGPFASLDGPSDRLGPGAPAEISAPRPLPGPSQKLLKFGRGKDGFRHFRAGG